ncbi:sigma-70 family RNA polymerase sigma factor [Kibdelosporangium lantanae]|uniref:Sigma-70 family RNA polymerase sigma factor n=1 Tax=Kibdelosporangium lantanae TaxID=1497396 RepID=A0ABW3M3Z6_9PSEU
MELASTLEKYAIYLGFREQRREIAFETLRRVLPTWGTHDNETAFAIVVLRNYVRDYGPAIRRDQGQLIGDDLLYAQIGHVVRDESDSWADSIDLQRAINSLPEDLREILGLIAFGGLSNTDVARELRISARTVKRKLNQAKDVLAEKLDSPRFRNGQ